MSIRNKLNDRMKFWGIGPKTGLAVDQAKAPELSQVEPKADQKTPPLTRDQCEEAIKKVERLR